MARYPKASWRPLGGRPEPRLVRKNKLIYHTMVGSLNGTDRYFREVNGPGFEGTESHFGTDPSRVYQWQDTNFQADAQLQGNDDCISVETADHGGPYAPWNTNVDDVPAWTDAHLEINAQLGAWVCLTHDIPPVLITNTRDATKGIGFHRDGIDPYRNFGERYSSVFAKACPGNRRYAQRHRLVNRIRQIMEGDIDMTPEQAKQLDEIHRTLRSHIRRQESTAGDDAPPVSLRDMWRYTHGWGVRNNRMLRAMQPLLEAAATQSPLSQEQVTAIADQLNRIDAEEIAEAVADEQAERLSE